MNFLPPFIPIDTFSAALPVDAPGVPPSLSGRPSEPVGEDWPHDELHSAAPCTGQPVADPSQPGSESRDAGDEWTARFTRAVQAQHARVRQFLQAQRERWRRLAATFTRQIDALQAEVHALQAANEGLHAELREPPGEEDGLAASEASQRYLMAMDDIRDLKARNAELQRQLQEVQSKGGRSVASAPGGGDWESQKRRLLAELESDDRHDPESSGRRLKIEEIVARTDKIIAEKNREIEELQHLLNNQSDSLGSLALGAAALDQALDQDAIIREERERLQHLQDDVREKLRQAEIELAMERARLARREAELEEKTRSVDLRRLADSDGEALAPTGRPIRGRWRTQLGLDDQPPEPERGRPK